MGGGLPRHSTPPAFEVGALRPPSPLKKSRPSASKWVPGSRAPTDPPKWIPEKWVPVPRPIPLNGSLGEGHAQPHHGTCATPPGPWTCPTPPGPWTCPTPVDLGCAQPPWALDMPNPPGPWTCPTLDQGLAIQKNTFQEQFFANISKTESFQIVLPKRVGLQSMKQVGTWGQEKHWRGIRS